MMRKKFPAFNLFGFFFKENVNTIFFLSRKLNKRKEFFKLFTEETNQES